MSICLKAWQSIFVRTDFTGEKMNYEEYKKILKERLKPSRYEHSLCVAEEAKRLALKYGCNEEKAYLAGLLHDITKNTSANEQLQLFEQFGIILSTLEKQSEKLWHAMSGEVYVKHILGIKDTQITEAIRYHTTAKADMTLLQKILYLADFTSADRDYDDVDEMRRLVDIGITPALQYALRYTVVDLAERSLAIHPDTLAAYNEVFIDKS